MTEEQNAYETAFPPRPTFDLGSDEEIRLLREAVRRSYKVLNRHDKWQRQNGIYFETVPDPVLKSLGRLEGALANLEEFDWQRIRYSRQERSETGGEWRTVRDARLAFEQALWARMTTRRDDSDTAYNTAADRADRAFEAVEAAIARDAEERVREAEDAAAFATGVLREQYAARRAAEERATREDGQACTAGHPVTEAPSEEN